MVLKVNFQSKIFTNQILYLDLVDKINSNFSNFTSTQINCLHGMGIQCIFDEKLLHFCNHNLNKSIQKFEFHLILKEYQTSLLNLQRKNKYNVIVVGEHIMSQNECNESDFYIIIFDYTLLLIPSSDFSSLFSYFEINSESIFYCTSEDVKNKIDQSGKQRNHFHFSEEKDRLLIEKISTSFLSNFELDFSNIDPEITQAIKFTWEIIQKSVSFFMIKIGFLNAKYDRNIHFSDYLKSGIEDKNDEFIELNLYNRGSSSSIYLVYLIKREEICLMKMFLKTSEEDKLFQREHENYLNIKHPLHSRYFGTTEYLSYKCLLIEYLEGRTLNEIDFANESTKNIMKIIFEIMIILAYLHHHGYIYRDLKPNNIIVDKNSTIYLIDFDRMIKSSSINSNQNITDNFSEAYIAPEILNGESFSYKSDIYSLGKVIEFIFSNVCSHKFIKIQQMFLKCISSKEEGRPSIYQLINTFYFDFFSVEFGIDDLNAKFNFESDIFTFYLFIIAEYQNANKQIRLEFINQYDYILYKDKSNNNHCLKTDYPRKYKKDSQCIQQDIRNAIHYYTLAANLNDSNAQYYLGVIYSNGEYITKDMNKAINYFILAANQNHPKAQYNLGNIKKGIYLITLSAMNRYKPANFLVGYFYHRGMYVKRDIDKAIHYYKEASSFNNQYAKNNLGILFKNGYKDEVVKKVGLSIEYFKEAIRQKDDEVSMYNLAHLYFYEDPIKDSIDKSIELLIHSIEKGFQQSKELLCLALLKKHNFNLDMIKEEIERISKGNKVLSFEVCIIINISGLFESKYFEARYEYNRNIDFLYSNELKPCISKVIDNSENITNSIPSPQIPKISKMFYEGFGFEI
ncbi:hypothetical protein M9Y10_025815 [Tritrichomonas musculus]|uniref:Protein kinase domain-containing protein n=1 Tax=Tritrichomonas musculus TaxID=1915356 RepID=A0ABR2H9R2_9EUKA